MADRCVRFHRFAALIDLLLTAVRVWTSIVSEMNETRWLNELNGYGANRMAN